MRSFVVASLAFAIVACLAVSVSAGGYGGHAATYQHYRQPVYGYRYLRQRYLISPGSGGYFGAGAGAGYYGGGGLANTAIGTGFNLIWVIVLITLALFLLNLDK